MQLNLEKVGGDFYDFFPFVDGRLGLVIGDVTGDGIPAALVMATTCSILHAVVKTKLKAIYGPLKKSPVKNWTTPSRMRR
jgi:serine phosphatase RsbU (regulator of sigma subunit)